MFAWGPLVAGITLPSPALLCPSPPLPCRPPAPPLHFTTHHSTPIRPLHPDQVPTVPHSREADEKQEQESILPEASESADAVEDPLRCNTAHHSTPLHMCTQLPSMDFQPRRHQPTPQWRSLVSKFAPPHHSPTHPQLHSPLPTAQPPNPSPSHSIPSKVAICCLQDDVHCHPPEYNLTNSSSLLSTPLHPPPTSLPINSIPYRDLLFTGCQKE